LTVPATPVAAAPWHRLSWRVFSGTAALVAILLAAVLGLATVGVRRAARELAQQTLEQSADLAAQLLAGRGRSLGGGARVFVQGPYFRTLVAERRRDDILDQTFEAAEQLDAAWVFITDEEGNLIAKSDEPSAVGEPMARVPLVSAALRGQVTTGYGGSGDSLLFQATAVPVAAPGGMPFGVLVATRVLDSLTAADIALATNQAVVFFVLDESGHIRVSATSLSNDQPLRTAVTRAIASMPVTGGAAHQEMIHAGRTWILHRSTLATAGGMPVGGYVVLRPSDEALTTLLPVQRSLLLAALLGGLCALAAGALTSRAIATPVAVMAQQVQQLVEQGEVTGAAARATLTTSRFASVEVSALANAVQALVTETTDQDILRALVSLQPSPDVETRRAPRGRARTLAFRAAAGRTITWAPGMVFAGRYRLDAELGRDEGGVLFRARDVPRSEVVALRLLRTDALPTGERASGAVVDSMLAAATHLMSLAPHRHLVRVYDAGIVDDTGFLSTEFVDGVALSTILQGLAPLEPGQVAAIARQCLQGLSALHAQRVLHGCLNTHTLLVSRAGVLKLAEGGMATANAPRRAAMTAYVAPEVLIGGAASPQSDLYAVGVLLHECLTGSTPFASQDFIEVLGAKLAATPLGGTAVPTPRAPAQATDGALRSTALLTLLSTMTHADVTRRPSSANAALQEWIGVGQRVNGRRERCLGE
jgi:hypothetical protein